MKREFYTLGIESSCDETSVSVLRGSDELLSNVIASQVDIHARFGGVVPEIAARKHTEAINAVIQESLEESGIGFGDISLIAVTVGPGLAVSLVVGISAAKALSSVLDVPAVGVNHLEGHLLANMLGRTETKYPAVCLLVSGGHTEIILVKRTGEYEKLGGTVDDAAGEAFDKVARLLDLGYPGGPAIQKAAKSGDPAKIKFPRPMIHENNLNMSFSGLKTAVLNYTKKNGEKIGKAITVEDIAASFQESVVDLLAQKTINAAESAGAGEIWLAGGVAANRSLRDRMSELCEKEGFSFYTPEMILCTDNAGMIAKAGYELYKRGIRNLPLSPVPSLSL
ncbi:MAG TPA: tRNA (adenosine(37)-N6)-threonylcarbamoyltransferase complex transferase subunit TsaD [bacterium]|nr:tRNA (adenosine(37)-N6)-threonylcarbamoyltransferase complex transferase subunit TsaD [bacterium]